MICSPFVRWSQVGLVLFASQVATAAMAGVPNEMLIAQVIPDGTLENNSEFIDGGVTDRIEGGTRRGGNLFHSFEEFNVNAGQEVYFVNPVGIENILSRVTGVDTPETNGRYVSKINGLLGVDGAANLFLLNPNGITFGPNAELDIRGSFTASTADTYQFGGAAEPVDIQGTDFLTMSVPLGVQFNAPPTRGDITTDGTLTVGQDLNLMGNQLFLGGQLTARREILAFASDSVFLNGSITSEGVPVNVTLNSDRDNSGEGAIALTNATIDSAQLHVLYALWTPSGVIWWQAEGAVFWFLCAAYGAAWLLLMKASFDAGAEVQSGALGWMALMAKVKPVFPDMPEKGLFRLIRQPIYLAFALTLWTVPVWTPDQLVLALLLTGYCVFAPMLKERRFKAAYGTRFEDYRAQVPYMLPRFSAPDDASRERRSGTLFKREQSPRQREAD